MKLVFKFSGNLLTCRACYGRGKIDYHNGPGMYDWIEVPCIYCHGTGRMEFKKL